MPLGRPGREGDVPRGGIRAVEVPLLLGEHVEGDPAVLADATEGGAGMHNNWT